ncbi:hydroxyacid dehydrogenase [Candidatus Bathyarchaeota archaeon]|nr:hydroxyacid dehydrogenase [Candidatus Bathyarchaeota archaeon]
MLPKVPKVLVTDSVDLGLLKELKKYALLEIAPNISQEDLIERVRDADILVIRGRTQVTGDVIKAAGRLKAIVRAGTGIDNVDLEAALEKGIYVLNAAEASADSVAEFTVGLMIALARRIPFLNESMKKGSWLKDKGLGIELRGKTLGIVGLGRIGSRVARIAKAMGMKVLAYDPYVSRKKASELEVELVDLETLLRSSDFISLHVPLTKETWRLIGEREIQLMKPSAFLINTARGGIVDEEALERALKSGKLAGVALDVFQVEPPSLSKGLLDLDNVILTPHIGGFTREAQGRIAACIAEDIKRVIRGEEPLNCVRLPTKRWGSFAKKSSPNSVS